MNNNRLSTSGLPRVDRAHLQIEIDKLLSGPSNLEEKEDGRIFIKSLNRYLSTSAKIRVELQDENGNAIKIFDSAADCAKCLGLARMTITNKLRTGKPAPAGLPCFTGKPVLFKNKLVYIKKVVNNSTGEADGNIFM